MKTLIGSTAVAALFALTPALPSAAQPAASTPAPKKAERPDPTRANVTQTVQRHFTRVDSNNDGYVTQAELDAAGKARQARVIQRRQQRGDATFERLDTNNDGSVTKAEAEAVFATGQVDIAHNRPGDARPRRNWDAISASLDANKDGAISRAEFDSAQAQRAQRRAARPAQGGLLHKADSNGDGRVTLPEASAAAQAHFDATDTNDDGIWSDAERAQARKGNRGN